MNTDHNIYDDFRKGSMQLLYKSFYPALISYSGSILGQRYSFLCEDCVQESIYKAYMNRENIKDANSLKSFLYTTVRNRAISFLRKDKSQSNYLRQIETSEQDITADIIEKETLRKLFTAVRSLPEPFRQVFELSFEQGLKNKEIAMALGVSESAIKKRKARLLMILKKLLISTIIFLVTLFQACEKSDGPKHLSQEEIDEIQSKKELNPEKYVEYKRGDCPVIITVPHGGTLVDSKFKVRNSGNCPDPDLANDLDYMTAELASLIHDSFFKQFKLHPYIVTSLIKRDHIDVNRKKSYAIPAGDDDLAMIYDYYHECISKAVKEISTVYGHGLLLDIHGQSHSDYIELGYLLSYSDLLAKDAELNSGAYSSSSSIRRLFEINKGNISFADLLRGEHSFGAELNGNGLDCCPSPAIPSPVNSSYFNGGYTTKTYGSLNGGAVDAIQMEFRYSYRDTQAERERAAAATAKSIKEFTELIW